jgi:hypothetical protein
VVVPALVLALVLAACTGTAQVTTSPSASGQSPSAVPTAGGPAATDPPTSPAAATPAPTTAVPDSGTWARIGMDGAAPEPREDHTWTVDGAGREAWLFGGRDGDTVFDELWAFDLRAGSWRILDVTGGAPAARFGHEAAWLPGRGLVVFGGQRGTTFFDDLWLFEPDGDGVSGSWRLLPPGGGAPVARYGSCSGIGPDGRLWISHGFTSDGARFADTLAYDFATETWSDQAPATERPTERCLHACWWTSGGQLALYGGQTTGVPALGDLWLFTPGNGGASTNAWAEVPGQAPAPRHLPAIARHGAATFLFGGRGSDREALAETWLAVDGGAGFEPFAASGDEPPARSGATLIHDSAGDRLLLFGGLGRNARNDLWALTFP